jgi:hypothetical protein
MSEEDLASEWRKRSATRGHTIVPSELADLLEAAYGGSGLAAGKMDWHVAIAGAIAWGPGRVDPALIKEIMGSGKMARATWREKADGVMVFGVLQKNWPAARNALCEVVFEAIKPRVRWVAKRACGIFDSDDQERFAEENERGCSAIILDWLLRGCKCWREYERMHVSEQAARARCETKHTLSAWNAAEQSLLSFLREESAGGNMANSFRYGMYAKCGDFFQLMVGDVPFCKHRGCHSVLPKSNMCVHDGCEEAAEVVRLQPWVFRQSNYEEVELWRCRSCARYFFRTLPDELCRNGGHANWSTGPTHGYVPAPRFVHGDFFRGFSEDQGEEPIDYDGN